MTDRKVLPYPIKITSELIQTIVDTLETAAEKHYREQALRNFIRRSISPTSWVIKDVIRHPDIVEKVKRFIHNCVINLPETTHSGQRVICKLVCNVYDDSVHEDIVATFWRNAREVDHERKQPTPTNESGSASHTTAPTSPIVSSNPAPDTDTSMPAKPPANPAPPSSDPIQTVQPRPTLTTEALHLLDTVMLSMATKIAAVCQEMHEELAQSLEDVHARIKSLADQLQECPKPAPPPRSTNYNAELIQQFTAALLAQKRQESNETPTTTGDTKHELGKADWEHSKVENTLY